MKETDYRKSPLGQRKLPTQSERFWMWSRENGKSMKEWLRTYKSLVIFSAFVSVATTLLSLWVVNNTDPVGECYLEAERGNTHVYVTEPLALDRTVAIVRRVNDLDQNRDALQIVKDIGCKFRP